MGPRSTPGAFNRLVIKFLGPRSTPDDFNRLVIDIAAPSKKDVAAHLVSMVPWSKCVHFKASGSRSTPGDFNISVIENVFAILIYIGD